MVKSTGTLIDVITFLNIFSREIHCGNPSGDFVETLICNQKQDLKPVSLRSIQNNGHPNGVHNLATSLGGCQNWWQKCLLLVISLLLQGQQPPNLYNRTPLKENFLQRNIPPQMIAMPLYQTFQKTYFKLRKLNFSFLWSFIYKNVYATFCWFYIFHIYLANFFSSFMSKILIDFFHDESDRIIFNISTLD